MCVPQNIFWRIANFINGELIGKVTDVSWSVIFPLVDMSPRHPSQIYEAVLEGLTLFIILNIIIFKKNYKVGTCSYLFLIFYGIFRIFSEFFREPDIQVGYLFNLISMGMLLSFLMIFIGVLIKIFLKKMTTNLKFLKIKNSYQLMNFYSMFFTIKKLVIIQEKNLLE